MTELGVWLVSMVGLPLAVVVASRSVLELEVLRRFAVACAGALLVAAALPLAGGPLAELALPWPVASGSAWAPLLGPSVIRTDVLSSVLLPVVAALWLLTVAVTPRSRLDRAGIRRTAIATLIISFAFATTSPLLLAIAWVGSSVPYLLALGKPQFRRARRVARVYLGASTVLLVAGVALVHLPGVPASAADAGLPLLVVAALIRKGIFPFHAWVPEVFERGPMGPAVLLSTPQLGSYVTVVLIVPHASTPALRVIAILALITAVYGAALALIQRDARRGLGYLFVSQSALVMAGLDCTSELAVAGSMVLWVSSALGFAGMARCVLVLEARRGRLDLSRFHGGYAQMPTLALGFLVLGLACTGFPGTLGFIGQELLVDGATETFAVLGFCVVAAAALTGLAVLRMYFSLFCGRSEGGPSLRALRGERLVFGALVAVLIIGGLVPGPLLSSRVAAAAQVLEGRGRAGY
ncbi:MAG: proton-conducting transporter membrane subunit [Enhygromyxa sp.]